MISYNIFRHFEDLLSFFDSSVSFLTDFRFFFDFTVSNFCCQNMFSVSLPFVSVSLPFLPLSLIASLFASVWGVCFSAFRPLIFHYNLDLHLPRFSFTLPSLLLLLLSLAYSISHCVFLASSCSCRCRELIQIESIFVKFPLPERGSGRTRPTPCWPVYIGPRRSGMQCAVHGVLNPGQRNVSAQKPI